MTTQHTLLPSSEDAEKALLSSFLNSPREVGMMCAERGITHELFHVPSHSIVMRALTEMQDASVPIDAITLSEHLRSKGLMQEIGGMVAISQLCTFIPTSANAGYYGQILREKYTLREIIRICSETGTKSYTEQDNVEGILDEAERRIFDLVNSRHGRQSKTLSMSQVVRGAISLIQEAYERRGAISGLSTGLASLDKATDGLHGHELCVIAGRPSHGKTALAMQMAEHIALDQKRPVAVFSLEMSAQQLVQRMICSRAKINMARIREGTMAQRDFDAITATGSKFSHDTHMHLEDGSDMTVSVIRARARALQAQYGIQAVFIDSLSVIRGSAKDRWLEIKEITTGLKNCAKELGIPVVLIVHLGREVDKQKRRPRLSDLREGGDIEQNADLVLFVVREELMEDDEEKKAELAGSAIVRIGKIRTGDMDFDVPLTFVKQFTRFEERADENRRP